MRQERGVWLAAATAVTLLLACPPTTLAWLNPATDPTVVTVLNSEDSFFSFPNGPSDQLEWSNQGGVGSTLRMKGFQYVCGFRWNLASYKGQVVDAAELHLCRYLPAGDTSKIFALAASTINADWHESAGTGASYLYRLWGSPAQSWTFKNGDFSTACFGSYGTLVTYGYTADDTFKSYVDGNGKTWVALKLTPAQIYALILDNYGLGVTDPRSHAGTSVPGNPYIYAKESGAAVQPKLLIKFSPQVDTTAPAAVSSLSVAPGPENRQAIVTFTAPADADVFGYTMKYGTSSNFAAPTNRAVDRWRIVRPKPGQQQKVLIENITPVLGMPYYFFIQPYDEAGNNGPVSFVTMVPEETPATTLTNGLFTTPNPAGKTVRTVGTTMKYWAASELAKINPVTGNRYEDGYSGSGADDYKKANAVWDSATNTISLQACRNEVVGAQLILQRLVTNLTNVQLTVSDLTAPNGLVIPASPYVELFQLHYVSSAGTYYPEAAIPLYAPFPTTFSIPDTNHNVAGQNQSVWIDIYVPTYTGLPASPTSVDPGDYTGTLTVTATQLASPVTINLKLRVSPITIPDDVSFLVDYNGYSSGAYDPNQSFFDWDFGTSQYHKSTVLRFYQTLHKHRANPNPVPYGWGGLPSNTDRAPTCTGAGPTRHAYDWSLFDAKYGPMFVADTMLEQADPSKFAFSRLNPTQPYYGPGENTPVSTFYAPFFESWPIPLVDTNYGFDAGLAPHKGGAYWNNLLDSNPASFFATAPDLTAFTAGYVTGTTNVVTDWFNHAATKKWTKTNFQSFLNNKYTYTNCAALWTLEECETADDFKAVGYLHNLWRTGQALANKPEVKWHFRIDISDRWGQHWGQLDNRVNWQVLGAGAADWHWPNKNYRTYVFDPDKQETWAWYGDGVSVNEGNNPIPQTFLKRWCQGFDGAVPWYDCFQTSWAAANDLSLIYSGNGVPGFGVYEGCLVSIRVKAIRQTEQIIELLNKWSQADGMNRPRVRDALVAKYSNSPTTWGYPFTTMDENKVYALRADLQAQIETLFLASDFNGDGSVDVLDLLRLAGAWASMAGDPNYDAWCDLNDDGGVDVLDLLALADEWGSSQPVP